MAGFKERKKEKKAMMDENTIAFFICTAVLCNITCEY